MSVFRSASMVVLAFLAGCGAGKANEPTVMNVSPADAGPPVIVTADPSADVKLPATPPPELAECETRACKGAITKELESALSMRARKAHRCYDTALVKSPTLQGRVTLEVRVSEDGSTCRARSIGQSSLGDAGVAECIAAAYKSPGFPPPKGGCMDVNIPIQLSPNP